MEPVERTLRVHYPRTDGALLLRTEEAWDRDVQPVAVEEDGTSHVFRLRLTKPFLYFKPILRRGDDVRWSVGSNLLVVAALEAFARDVYPFFDAPRECAEAALREEDDEDGRRHAFRVFLPPGYAENTLGRFPVVYMQDGQNLFFRGEAFQGRTWRVRETLGLLTEMNQTAEMIVVGVQPRDRMSDYTKPGYQDYGRFLVEELKPRIDAEFRTLKEPAHTAVMGSSLGGVVSLHLAWHYAQVFGMAACLSSTFGHRDDLTERIADEPRRDLTLYLDSGYPRDNFEVTKQMVALLLDRGYRLGEDLLYLAFPEARHDESAWATRLHVPFQFLFGAGRQLRLATPATPVKSAKPRRARPAR